MRFQREFDKYKNVGGRVYVWKSRFTALLTRRRKQNFRPESDDIHVPSQMKNTILR